MILGLSIELLTMKINIQFYNSLTKKKEVFLPARLDKVNIYVCGVTVYDLCHLGHARGAISFDLLRKFLQATGYQVTFVKNYTDIDDKIIKQARIKGITTEQLTKQMILEHDRDMESLFVAAPDKAPRATENVAEMITMISALIEQGSAYEKEGDVLFRVSKFTQYGKLSGNKLADLQAGSRVEINQNKENPLDFVLWKHSKTGEPYWNSPWGIGRPGWHIECSCMCKKFIDGVLDIHGGGTDLIFPHHENEIAQSESLSQKKMANYWLHNGMIEIDGRKMSKSLGNFTKIRDLVLRKEHSIYQGYDPRIIRFFMLQSHYRQNLLFSKEALHSAYQALTRIYVQLINFEKKYQTQLALGKKITDYKVCVKVFFECLADDLNSPKAIAQIFEWCAELKFAIEQETMEVAEYSAEKIVISMKVLGLIDDRETLAVWLAKRRKPLELKTVQALNKLLSSIPGHRIVRIKEVLVTLLHSPTEQNLNIMRDVLMKSRADFRLQKDWVNSDKIRELLLKLGFKVKDSSDGSVWSYN